MSIRLLSYNVRYSTLDSGDDVWAERRDGVASVIRFHAPDVVCLQEVWEDQLSDLRDRLPAYAWVHADTASGEHTPIGYRPDRVTVRDSDAFSLSETPGDLHAMDWDTTVPRVTTTAGLDAAATDRAADRREVAERASSEGQKVPRTVRTAAEGRREQTAEPRGRAVRVVNTHLDHESERARRRGAALLADRFGDRDGVTVLAGDFNCGTADAPYRTLTDDGGFRPARELADDTHGPLTTFNDFEAPQSGERLDHVLVDGVAVDRFGVLADLDDRGRYPSDHFAVLADLTLAD
jgi:endonuclease/exonuclease/phosphatase family metal-dependent hydrolase